MDDYVDTIAWPARRVQLTEAQMREHSKRPRKRPHAGRPYIARGLDQQGRGIPTGNEFSGGLMVALGIVFLGAGAWHLVAWWWQR